MGMVVNQRKYKLDLLKESGCKKNIVLFEKKNQGNDYYIPSRIVIILKGTVMRLALWLIDGTL